MANVKKKRKSAKRRAEANALKFSCFLLALIIAITAVVFITLDKHNDKLLQKGNGTTESPKDTQAAVPGSTSPAPGGTTAPVTEPETALPVLAPGTIDNPTIITIDEENWHLTLVNSCYRIPDDYEPNLVYVCGSAERLDAQVAVHYEDMYNAALKDGITLTPCSGYRSYELQERNYNNKVSFFESQGYSHEEAKIEAASIIMPPGSSEHNLGYAMDIICVEEYFEDTDAFTWLTENAADYGFIMRYPKDKQDITKVIYEPWHWRYVGVELAHDLKDSGLVLEEYMGVA